MNLMLYPQQTKLSERELRELRESQRTAMTEPRKQQPLYLTKKIEIEKRKENERQSESAQK